MSEPTTAGRRLLERISRDITNETAVAAIEAEARAPLKAELVRLSGTLEAQVAELRAALEAYGEHDRACPMHPRTTAVTQQLSCCCGLDTILDASDDPTLRAAGWALEEEG